MMAAPTGVTILDARKVPTAMDTLKKGKQPPEIPGAKREWWADYVDGSQQGRLDSDLQRLSARITALGVCAERPVVVYGEWGTGWGEEGRIYWMLKYLNHTRVSVLYGGIWGWTKEIGGAAIAAVPQGTCAQPFAAAAIDDDRTSVIPTR